MPVRLLKASPDAACFAWNSCTNTPALLNSNCVFSMNGHTLNVAAFYGDFADTQMAQV